jgi:anti-sigma regulatory factor (Ser/Thr protein kinase)
VRDLSERKRAEDDLRLVTAGARCLLWHALVEDTGGDTLRWDITVPDEQAAQQFLPLTVPPGRSYTDAFYESRLPEDRVRTDADAVQCMRACQQGYSQEFRCQDKDGRVRWLKEDARVTSLGAGRWRAVGVCTDVTELKRAEEEKARLLDQVRAAAQQQRAFLRDVLASVTQGRLRLVDRIEELPPRREPVGGEPVALSAASLRALRHRVAQAAAALGFDKDTGNDLVTAVGEAAMNVVAHAKEGVGSVGMEATTGTVQVWIEDKGGGIDLSHLPRATLERGFSVGTTPGIGHGFWLMLQTAHRVWLLTGSAGTMVVLEQDRTAPEPGWLAQA